MLICFMRSGGLPPAFEWLAQFVCTVFGPAHSPSRLSLWGKRHIETGDDWASNWSFDQRVSCANVDAIPVKIWAGALL